MPWIECIVNAGKAGYTTRTIHAYCEKAAKRIIGYENEINWNISKYLPKTYLIQFCCAIDVSNEDFPKIRFQHLLMGQSCKCKVWELEKYTKS